MIDAVIRRRQQLGLKVLFCTEMPNFAPRATRPHIVNRLDAPEIFLIVRQRLDRRIFRIRGVVTGHCTKIAIGADLQLIKFGRFHRGPGEARHRLEISFRRWAKQLWRATPVEGKGLRSARLAEITLIINRRHSPVLKVVLQTRFRRILRFERLLAVNNIAKG